MKAQAVKTAASPRQPKDTPAALRSPRPPEEVAEQPTLAVEQPKKGAAKTKKK